MAEILKLGHKKPEKVKPERPKKIRCEYCRSLISFTTADYLDMDAACKDRRGRIFEQAYIQCPNPECKQIIAATGRNCTPIDWTSIDDGE